MRFVHGEDGVHEIELSRRNLETLLAKLDDPASARTLIKDDDDYPGHMIMVKAVEDSEHYSNRAPGEIYMPSTGVRMTPRAACSSRMAR